ncbi:hypothetical protein EON78_05175, partial [bacterium]
MEGCGFKILNVMFQLEKEMIPVLVDKLSKEFKTTYFLEEFNSGNGIADLVFTTKVNNEQIVFNDYALMSTFIEYFYKWEKRKCSIGLQKSFNNARVEKMCKYLLNENYLSFKGDSLVFNRPYLPHTKNLFSIEAKLKDWRAGFYQALRYQFFSHKSFLAISAKYVHRVDLALLKDNNIGLMSVYEDKV